MPTCHTSFNRRRRGSVMILVVAVLGLLAVIGTVYIVAARTDRTSAIASSTNINADLARSAVLNRVQQVIGSSMMDATGAPGGCQLAPATYGTLAARNFDYPETNGTIGHTTYNTSMRDEPWLATNLYNLSGSDYSSVDPLGFDPSSGTYDIALNGAYSYNNVAKVGTTVVGDYFPNAASVYDPGSPNSDSYMYLLPFSDATGIRYRYGIRIIDTNRMANLNTGAPADNNNGAAFADPYGQYISSYGLAPSANATTSQQQTMFAGSNTAFGTPADVDSQLHFSGTPNIQGRGGSTTTAFGLATWQSVIMHIERPYDTTGNLALFDLSDELELRSYGNKGTYYHPRFVAAISKTNNMMWLNTLSNLNLNAATNPSTNIVGNTRRGSYTTYSFSRDIRPYPDLKVAQQFTANGSNTLAYPMTYAKVPINLPLNSDPLVLDQVATEVANAMKLTANRDYASNTLVDNVNGNPVFPANASVTPFTQDEIAAFTINYIGARWDGMVQDASNSNAYFLPNGPSFVDTTGIHIRTATSASALVSGNYTGANDVKTSANTFVAYAAQPFINEVALYGTAPDTTTAPTITDCAIELYNPYNFSLSLKGFKLTIDSATTINFTNQYIPANGFFIITTMTNGSSFHAPTSGGNIQVYPTGSLPANGGPIGIVKLYRPCGTTSGFAQIDQTSFALLLVPGTTFTTNPAAKSVGRDNAGTGTAAWGCAFEQTNQTIRATNLGALNGGGSTGYPLYDRFAGTPQYTTQEPQQSGFANIAEFNRTMRICHQIDGSTGDAVPNGLVMTQMYNILTASASAPFSNMQFGQQAKIYFDFRPHPRIYNTCPPDEVTGAAPIYEGDVRATRLLDQITCIDRVGDTSIDIGGGNTDINKIRLPGQINVNTASGDVLRAIPNMTDPMVANILAYRNRNVSGTATYNSITSATYSAASYPGSGIRSLAELIIPISDASPPGSLDARDALWGSIYNLCTVRSDTFVVYGYLEAIRIHPNAPSHDNQYNWYDCSGVNTALANATTDDPHATTATLPNLRNLRVARRRWVAIIDRSWSNTPQTIAPRIVAIKDLPQ